MKVLSNYLIQVLDYATCRGIAHGIESPERDSYVPVTLYLEAFEECFKHSNDPYFGLNFGTYLSLEALGAVYEVSMATGAIGQAIMLWKVYAQANFPMISFEHLEKETSFELTIQSQIPRTEILCQTLDMICTFVLRELKLMLGRKHPEISLGLPYKQLEPYKNQFKGHLVTYSDQHQLIINASLARLEINKQQVGTLGYVLPAFLNTIPTKRFPDDSFARSVRHMMLNMCNPDIPSIQEVASQFAMTARTLQRNLKKEHITYREMVDEVREQLYFYLSGNQKLKTVQIAHLLGYSSSSAFLHASQRWRMKKGAL